MSDACVRETAARQRVALARDDRDRMTGGLEALERVGDFIVAVHHSVVMRELILAIAGDERRQLGFIRGVASEHRREGDADSLQPFLIAGRGARALLEREARRLE